MFIMVPSWLLTWVRKSLKSQTLDSQRMDHRIYVSLITHNSSNFSLNYKYFFFEKTIVDRND